jgi:hypothetical protein
MFSKGGKRKPRALRHLALQELGLVIQEGEHSSVDDARAGEGRSLKTCSSMLNKQGSVRRRGRAPTLCVLVLMHVPCDVGKTHGRDTVLAAACNDGVCLTMLLRTALAASTAFLCQKTHVIALGTVPCAVMHFISCDALAANGARHPATGPLFTITATAHA